MSGAAILGEEGEEVPHATHLDGVADIAPLTPRADQAGTHQFFEMERQGGSADPDNARYITCGHSRWPAFNEQSEYREPVVVRQGGKGGDCVLLIH